MDEARFGLKMIYRRRWCPFGHRPPWVADDQYEWLWLYAAFEPTTGHSFFAFLPHLTGACFEEFLAQWRTAVPEGRLGVVLDNSSSHTSQQVTWPDEIIPLPLPPYSPELNPVERFFKELRDSLANQIFESLDALEQTLEGLLRRYWENPPDVVRLLAYPWWQDGLQTITTPSE